MGLFKQKKPEELRKHARINNALRINYQIANDAMHSDCFSKDISEGGIRLNLYRKLEVGTALKLSIYFQDYCQPSYVIGQVAWLKNTPDQEYPYEAGIKFNFLGPALRTKIQNHIKNLSEEKT